MTDNRNTILAVILSGLVLIAWQYFYNVPQMERQRALQQTQAELAKPTAQATPGSTTPQASTPTPSANAPAANQPASAGTIVARDTAIAASPRIKISTPRLSGSISLRSSLSCVAFSTRSTVSDSFSFCNASAVVMVSDVRSTPGVSTNSLRSP